MRSAGRSSACFCRFFPNRSRPRWTTPFELLIGEHPLSAEVAKAVAALYAARGDFEKGEALYEKVRTVKPDDHETHCSYAIFLHNAGRYEQAVAVLPRAVRTDPNCPTSRAMLVFSLFNLGRWEETIAAADEALGLQRGNYVMYALRGFSQYALGRHAESKSSFDEALKPPYVYSDYGNRWLHFQSENLRLLGDWEGAWTIAEGLRKKPNWALAGFGTQMSLLWDRDRRDEALRMLDEELAEVPGPGPERLYLELYYRKQAGQIDRARPLAELCLQDTRAPNAAHVSAAVLLGREAEARALLASPAFAAIPIARLHHVQRAEAQALLGDRAQALESLQKAGAAGAVWPARCAPNGDLASVWEDPRFVALRARTDPTGVEEKSEEAAVSAPR